MLYAGQEQTKMRGMWLGSDYLAGIQGPLEIPLVLDLYHMSSVWFSSLRKVLPLTKSRSKLQSEQIALWQQIVRLQSGYYLLSSFFFRNASIPWSLMNAGF